MGFLKTFADGRIELVKLFGKGITVKSYPTNTGAFQPHINWPNTLGELSDLQLSILEQYGLVGSWSNTTSLNRKYLHIYFKGKKEVKNNIEALTLVEALKPIASGLIDSFTFEKDLVVSGK